MSEFSVIGFVAIAWMMDQTKDGWHGPSPLSVDCGSREDGTTEPKRGDCRSQLVN